MKIKWVWCVFFALAAANAFMFNDGTDAAIMILLMGILLRLTSMGDD